MEVQQNIRIKTASRMRIIMYFVSKRIIDIIVSTLLLVLLSPFLLIIGLIIYKREGGPILYKQARIGKHKRPFILLTFRTTTIPTKVIRALPPHPFPTIWSEGVPNEFAYKTNSASTVTSTGSSLKKYHLDMLPQLVNVLKGDMSLIGPHPEIPEIAHYYNEKQVKRLSIKPGVTGYAQINGKSNSNHGQKIAYDLYYIKNCSLRFDMKILFQAISNVIKK